MLRIIESMSGVAAKRYFTESLNRGDYYTEGQEFAGVWGGLGAERLGLSGLVQQDDFFALCENRHPGSGDKLTVRTFAKRRVGYDINFHVPKSVSLVYALTGDPQILEAFRAATARTMVAMEREMQTRVRLKKHRNADSDRLTGNLTWAEFVHLTARPVNGRPDPHLHAHFFTFNATYDSTEARWKAGQFVRLKKQAPLFEAMYISDLAQGLTAVGYAVVPRGKYFEIDGISLDLVRRFSRRTSEIEKLAKDLGVDDDPREKAGLGARTRQAKEHNTPYAELRNIWASEMSREEREQVRSRKGGKRDFSQETQEPAALEAEGESGDSSREKSGGEHREASSRYGVKQEVSEGSINRAALRAVRFALADGFERRSVLRENDVIEKALRDSVGQAGPEDVRRAFDSLKLLHGERDGVRVVSHVDVIAEEREMIAYARQSLGKHKPLLNRPHKFREERLNEEQRDVVNHVLHSSDGVVLIRGGAGTGKTFLFKEAIGAIESPWFTPVPLKREVVLLSPTTPLVQALRKDGFTEADTVQRFLISKDLRDKAIGGVIWVDEAGLLGSRQVNQIFTFAESLCARVVFCGDQKQHYSVERGDAFRLLVERAQLRVAQLTRVLRQRGEYREAAEHFVKGDMHEGFRQLEQMGAVVEVKDKSVHKAAAEAYVEAVKRGKSVLGSSPTHKEGRLFSDLIREGLQAAKLVSTRQRKLESLSSLNLTRAQKLVAGSYKVGDVVAFHQNARGFKAGDKTDVLATDRLGNVWVRGKLGVRTLLSLSQADTFDVFEKSTLEVARGDTIRFTSGGRAVSGQRIHRNATARVLGFLPVSGDLILKNGHIVSKNFGHISHGYVSTSPSSQGKTFDVVIDVQTKLSTGAESAEQMYVTATRGREWVQIFTDNVSRLRDAISHSSSRVGAVEVNKWWSSSHHFVRAREANRQRMAQEFAKKSRERERTHERV